MPRPSTPQIAKKEVFRTALAILDSDGIEGLTVRRLAEQLNVKNASLYYHFAGKDEIVDGAAELALAGVGVPPEDGEHWRSWLLRSAISYRRRLLEHPALISVMHTRGPFRFTLDWFDEISAYLAGQGVPNSVTLPLLETLNEFVVGSVMAESQARRSGRPRTKRPLTHQQRFELGCTNLIDGIVHEFGLVGVE